MSESLLSISEVLLFGRVVEDLRILNQIEGLPARAATIANVASRQGTGPIDGVTLVAGDNVLVRVQNNAAENGLYKVGADTSNTWAPSPLGKGTIISVKVDANSTLGGTSWEQILPLASGKQKFRLLPDAGNGRRRGKNRFIEEQLFDEGAQFARIYGFSFEGTYYELPNPTLFLVHGDGESATAGNLPNGTIASADGGSRFKAQIDHAARAPLDPSFSGVASADYQISDDIRVWAYDKADYTIRMDAMTGMFEQALLDQYFGYDDPSISGAKVSGAKVSGAKVAGAKVSGAKVAGAKVSGAKARGPGD